MKEKGIILSIDAQVAMLRDGYPVLMLPMAEQPTFHSTVPPMSFHYFQDHTGKEFICPAGEAGDGIWVRESYGIGPDGEVRYRADHPSDGETTYLSPIKMGKDKARLRFTISGTMACTADTVSEIALAHLETLDLGADKRQDVIARVVDLLPMDPKIWVWVVLLVPPMTSLPAPFVPEPASPPAWVDDMTAAVAKLDATLAPPGPFKVLRAMDHNLPHAGRLLVISADPEPWLNPNRENADDPLMVAVLEEGTEKDARLLAASWTMRNILQELVTLRQHKQRGFTGEVSKAEYERRREAAWADAAGVLAHIAADKPASDAEDQP